MKRRFDVHGWMHIPFKIEVEAEDGKEARAIVGQMSNSELFEARADVDVRLTAADPKS